MPSPEPFLLFTRRLNDLGVRHMVTGSVAAIFYGEPRMTNDVDIVLFLRREEAGFLEKAFPGEDFYLPPREVIQMEIAREQRGHFNIIHHETGFKADIYLSGRDELHAWALEHVNEAELDGDKVCFAPPEYVIVRKLQFFREGRSQKHLRDISRMVAGLGEGWSHGTLVSMINSLGLHAEWEEALAFQS